MHRLLGEIVQRGKTRHHGRQGGRNLRIAGVGPMFFTVHHIPVDLRMKGLPHCARRTGELNHRPARCHTIDLEALSREPIRHRLNIGIGRAELPAKLLGSEPHVIVGGRLGLLCVQKFPQRGLLVSRALQDQQHAFRRQTIGRRPLVEFGTRQWVSVPPQCDPVLRIHSLRHARRYDVPLLPLRDQSE